MELSLFLARSWGLFVALICLGILLNRKKFLSILTRMDPVSFFIVGMLILGIGAVQIVGYENWTLNWKGLITLFGWLSLLKGVAIIFIPGYSEKFVKIAAKENLYTASLVIGLLLGIYLLYVGYMMY